MKATMYGGEFCIECRNAKELLKNEKNLELQIKDITSSTSLMKEFLSYRDKEEIFEDVKKDGRIGIPFFILEDGTMTFDVNELLKENVVREIVIGEEKNACSIDGKGNC